MNIVVTGASRGIGYDTVLSFAQNPDHQIFVLARSVDKLKQLQQAAQDKYGFQNIHVIGADLTNVTKKELAPIFDTINHIDILINNAGVLINKPFTELEHTDWQTLFNVNLFAPVNLIQLFLPLLKAAKLSHVLNISSMGGFQGSSKFPGLSAYSASKAALANLTECLAEEFKDDNIRMNCIALGAVQTEMLAEAFPGYQAPVDSVSMGEYLADFAQKGHHFQNGKVIALSVTTP